MGEHREGGSGLDRVEAWLDRWAPQVLAVLTALFCLPLFFEPMGIGGHDEFRRAASLDAIYSLEHPVTCLETFGELPLRTPFGGGGYPCHMDPVDSGFTPLMPLSRVFGGVITIKLMVFFATWLGALILFLMGRRLLALSPAASLFGCLGLAFSGWLPSQAMAGQTNIFLLFSTVVLYLVVVHHGSRRHHVLAGLVLGALFLVGPHFVRGFLPVLIFADLLFTQQRTSRKATSALARIPLPLVAWLLLALLPLSIDALPRPASLALCAAVLAAPMARRAIRERYLPTVWRLGAVLGVALAVSAGRMIAVFRLLAEGSYERIVHVRDEDFLEAYRGIDEFYDSAGLFARALLDHVPLGLEHAADGSPTFYEHAYLGLGPGVLACFLVGLVVLHRRATAWLTLLAAVTLVCFGPHLPGGIDVYAYAVQELPGFGSLSQPYKYFNFYIAFLMAGISGGAIHLALWWARRRGRWAIAAVAAAAILVLGTSAAHNGWVFHEAMKEPLLRFEPEPSYFQLMGAPSAELARAGEAAVREFHDTEGSEYRDAARPATLLSVYNLQQGIGTIDWSVNIHLSENASPRYFVLDDGTRIENPDYRGEAYFEGCESCTVESLHIRANTIEADVRVTGPTTLVINQNHDPYFRVDRGTVTQRHGLLAVELDEEGTYGVELVYRPWTFIGMTALAGLLSLAALAFGASRPRQRSA